MSYQEQSTPDRSDILNAVLAAGDACSSGEQETVVFSDVKMEPVQASASPSRPNTVDQVNIIFILANFCGLRLSELIFKQELIYFLTRRTKIRGLQDLLKLKYQINVFHYYDKLCNF